MVKIHIEPFKEEPILSVVLIQIIVEVPGGEPKGVELPVWSQQQHCRRLLVVHARVITWWAVSMPEANVKNVKSQPV